MHWWKGHWREFHEVSMQNRRTRWRSRVNSLQSWVEHFEFDETRKTLSSTYKKKLVEKLCCLAMTRSPSTRKQENTQLVKPYERTYHWHMTMVRVRHVNSQNTALNPTIITIVTHLNIFQQLHEGLRKENRRATVRRGVCMKSNNQNKL